jgi:4-azaleucine resistance transporter AzlC
MTADATSGCTRTTVQEGLKVAWPICLGYAPIGLAFGVLAQKAGLAPWQTGIMSLMVFAGGSQFIAVAMLGGGAAALPVIATTFMVNLRHFLMSSALSVHMGGASRRFLSLFAYGVTDESFAVNMARFREGEWDRQRALVVNQAANAAWFVSTVAGAWVGQFIPAGAFGIDYALTAMFVCLLVFQLHGWLYVMTALVAGVLSVALYLVLPGNAYVMVASVSAATVGALVKRWVARRRVTS